MTNPKAFIFYGPSGSGKGTQAKHLIEFLKEKDGKEVLYVETGQQFRDFLKNGSYTSKLTKEVLDNGGLLPPFLPIWTWTDFFIKNFTGEENLVMDGLCRRPAEATILDSALKFYGINQATLIVLNVSREVSINRLQARARHDDSLEFINHRLDWYEQEVVPTIEFFRENSDYIVLDIDGEQSIKEVQKEIKEKVNL